MRLLPLALALLASPLGAAAPIPADLPDFSYAGYHRGEAPIPDVAVATNARDFGAVGDGVADDTKAIQAAIDATPRGAVLLPAGRYKVTDYINITRSGVVLRGVGPDQTALWFPRGLDEVHPKKAATDEGNAKSGYSFDGAFVTIRGDYGAQPLAKIVATAKRGERTVEVDSVAGIAAGQWVLVVLRETPDHSLKTFLYSDDPGDIRRGKQLDTRMVLRVTAVAGTRVTFDRPLRFETRAEWRPTIRTFNPTVTESGIEGLAFEFPPNKYRGHFKENGANAIELRQVAHCWVRNVAIRNGDLGINLVACHNTVDGVTYTAEAARAAVEAGVPCTGHHAIQCKHAEDNFITNFDLRTSYVHDLSVENSSGNVWAHGRGVDVNFDHHKDTPYENLYTDIDCGAGTRVWHSGGSASLGRQSGAWETFWAIRAAKPIAPPPAGWGPATMNFLALQTGDLHAAQLAQRLNSSGSLQSLVDRAAQTALEKFAGEKLTADQLAITLVDLRDPAKPATASVRGSAPIYPASVVKLFYLAAAHRWMEDGKIADTAELRRALKDMIVLSYNEATSYVVDVLTDTTSGPELSDADIKAWFDKRNAVNRYFASLGYSGINVNKKPWGEGPYGRETQASKLFEQKRNMLTTDATARLLAEIATDKCVSAKRSAEMRELLSRDPASADPDPDNQARFTGPVLPPGSKLWSKAGWTSTARHDAAYVELPNGAKFVLVVFTTDHAKQTEIIRTVAKTIVEGMR